MATDISDAMVTHIREEAARRAQAHVSAHRLDAEALDLPDASFDVALCALGLMYVPDPLSAVREMVRMLRPGGRCVAAVWGARNKCGWADIFPIVDARVQSEVCPMFFHLGTGDTLAQVMTRAGLHDVSATRISATYSANATRSKRSRAARRTPRQCAVVSHASIIVDCTKIENLVQWTAHMASRPKPSSICSDGRDPARVPRGHLSSWRSAAARLGIRP